MEPIRGSRYLGRDRRLPRGPADYAVQIRRRQSRVREHVRLLQEAHLARLARREAHLNAHRGDGGEAESSASRAVRVADTVARGSVAALLVDYPDSDDDEEMAEPKQEMALVEEEAAVVDTTELEDAEQDAAQPVEQAVPDEQVMERVLARSVRSALRKQVRRHHDAAYDAEQLQAGILASKQFVRTTGNRYQSG